MTNEREGLRRSGAAEAELLVDNWTSAQDVLRVRFPDAKLEGDVSGLDSVPKVDLLAAGFPCTDLSQAGRTAGIKGHASGLVSYIFELLESADPTWLLIENVRNMLVLDNGNAMRYLVRNSKKTTTGGRTGLSTAAAQAVRCSGAPAPVAGHSRAD